MKIKKSAIIIFVLGVIINEWTLVLFSPDRMLQPATRGLIRGFNIFCILVGLIILNIDWFRKLWRIAFFQNRITKTVLYFLYCFFIIEMFSRFFLFYFNPAGGWLTSRLYQDSSGRISFVSKKIHSTLSEVSVYAMD